MGKHPMKPLIAPLAGAALAGLLAVGSAAAATPTASPSPVAPVATSAPAVAPSAAPVAPAAGSVLTEILGLTNTEIMTLRQQGLSLAQIAARQKVDPQRLIDALVAQWSARIDARLAVGAITADQAKTLKANLAAQAKAMVDQTALGGMRGSAVGAGPNGAMRGMGTAAGAAGGWRGGMSGTRGGMMGRGPAWAAPSASLSTAS